MIRSIEQCEQSQTSPARQVKACRLIYWRLGSVGELSVDGGAFGVVVHSGDVCPWRDRVVAGNGGDRSCLRVRGDSVVDDGWTGCGVGDLDDDRGVDGVVGDVGADDHDGRGAVGDGPVLATNRADVLARSAEPAVDRSVRGDVRSRDDCDARSAVRRRRPGSWCGDRRELCLGVDEHCDARAVCGSHRPVVACVGTDRARRQRHPPIARCPLSGPAHRRGRRSGVSSRRRSQRF